MNSRIEVGTRVRWNGASWTVSTIVGGATAVLHPVEVQPVVPIANLTVEPQAVYVNSGTTEYRPGDVVRDADDPADGRIWLNCLSSSAVSWWTSERRWCARKSLPERLTLLVRDGQVVQ